MFVNGLGKQQPSSTGHTKLFGQKDVVVVTGVVVVAKTVFAKKEKIEIDIILIIKLFGIIFCSIILKYYS